MSQKHIRNVVPAESFRPQRVVEVVVAMQIIMTKKLFILFITYAGVYQDKPVPVFYQQAPQGPATKIICIRGVQFIPDRFRNHAEHSTPIELEKTGIDCMENHFVTLTVNR